MSEEQKEEKKEEKDWDTVKQEVDQYKANYEKEKSEREKAIAENEAFSEQLQTAQSKIDELNKQLAAKSDKDEFPELNPDYVDGNVIKSVTQLKTALKKATEELAEIKGKEAQREEKEKAQAAKDYQDMMYNKIASPLDERYGTKYRGPAKVLAEKLVDEGKEKQPQDPIDAMLLLEKCYKQLSEKKEKETVRTDTGGGGSAKPASERKAGSLQEVLADMKKDGSWKEYEHPEPTNMMD